MKYHWNNTETIIQLNAIYFNFSGQINSGIFSDPLQVEFSMFTKIYSFRQPFLNFRENCLRNTENLLTSANSSKKIKFYTEKQKKAFREGLQLVRHLKKTPPLAYFEHHGQLRLYPISVIRNIYLLNIGVLLANCSLG